MPIFLPGRVRDEVLSGDFWAFVFDFTFGFAGCESRISALPSMISTSSLSGFDQAPEPLFIHRTYGGVSMHESLC